MVSLFPTILRPHTQRSLPSYLYSKLFQTFLYSFIILEIFLFYIRTINLSYLCLFLTVGQCNHKPHIILIPAFFCPIIVRIIHIFAHRCIFLIYFAVQQSSGKHSINTYTVNILGVAGHSLSDMPLCIFRAFTKN